jgi:hypothetical protein
MTGLNSEEAAFLQTYRKLPETERRLILAAIQRCVDGVPLEEVLTDLFAQIDYLDPEEARRMVRVILAKRAQP